MSIVNRTEAAVSALRTPAPVAPPSGPLSPGPASAPGRARRPAPRRLLGAVLAPGRRGVLIAGAVYLAYALFLTWPLATVAGHSLSGAQVSGDLGASTAQFAYLIKHGLSPFLPGTMSGINAPEGLSVPWVVNWASAPDRGLIYALALTLGPVLGANVFLWLGFVFSGLSMFMLTRRLFASELAAGLAGFAFAFYPFAVAQIGGHIEYMDGWVLVLGVWRMLELALAPSRRNALLAGCAIALGMWFTPYFILIGGVGYLVLGLITLLLARRRGEGGRTFGLLALSGLPVLLLLGAIGTLTVLAGGTQAGDVRAQNIEQLNVYSARWHEWFLPDSHNLIFGGLTHTYLARHLHGSNFTESSLYLGLSVVVLALVGVTLAIRRLRSDGRRATGDPRVVGALGGAGLAIAAAAFSAPPIVHVLGVPVAMPSGFVFRISSTWRVYTRFVELLELGLCILMAYAVAELLRHRRPGRRAAVFAALGLLLVLDLWARPPAPRTATMSPPPEYVWLAHHPGGIVADYPLRAGDFGDYSPWIYGEQDGHPSFQGYAPGTEIESQKLGLVSLREPGTAAKLAGFGVRYVVVHPGQPGGDAADMTRRGYILRFASRQGAVWQLTARPPRTQADALDGFSPVLGPPGGEYRWILAPTQPGAPAVIGVSARDCARCRATLTFTSASNGRPRWLTVRDAATGGLLARRRIPGTHPVSVRIAGIPLVGGHARLDLTTDIPALPSKANQDLGWLSIDVTEPRLTLG